MFPALIPTAETILSWLIHAAWQAGLLAVVVLSFSWFLGSRLQPRWRFALWLVVFARLAAPVLPESPWSVFQLVSVSGAPQAAAAVGSSPALPQPIAHGQMDWQPDGLPNAMSMSQANPNGMHGTAGSPSNTKVVVPSVEGRNVSLIQLAALIWVAGVVILSLRFGANVVQLHLRQRRWQLVTDPDVLSVLRNCSGELRFLRSVSLYATPDNLGPATCGIVRPRIVLPQSLFDQLSPVELRQVLLHELIHVQRHDVLVDQLIGLITILHWFHPVAWVSRCFLRRERELACDVAVLEQSPMANAADYGHVILKTVESLAARPAPLPGLVGMFSRGPLSLLHRRILLIGAYRRSTSLSLLLGGVLLVAFALVGLTDAQTKQQQAVPAQEAAVPAKQVPPAAKSQPAKVTAEKDESTYSIPITVSGRALDPDEKPIAGAEIFLASPRTNNQPLATTKTDDQGNYRFETIPLSIKRADTNAGQDVGCFEVFGRAGGFGFAWRPLKWFFPNSAHVDGSGPDPTWDLPHRYGREDPIEINVYFGPPTTLRGRIVNDVGEPLADARLAIRRGQPADDERSLRNLESFNETSLVPEAVKTRRTDKDGRFEFTDLPNNCKFSIDVSPVGHPPRSIYASTAKGFEADARGERIYSGDFEVVFPRPRQVKLRVIYGDTEQPAVKVGVGGNGVAGFWETTDDAGAVEVPLPDGEYQLSLLPRYRSLYLRTSFDVIVSAESVQQPISVKLRPAAVVDISVVDADTRQPLAGADVWFDQKVAGDAQLHRRVHGYRSWEVETRISHYEAPRSDKDGKMRVLFEPGKQRIGVGLAAYPKGYEAVDSDGKEIECQPGVPTAIEFAMRKQATAGLPARAPVPGIQPTKAPAVRMMRIRVLKPDNVPIAGAKVFANVTLVDPVRIINREYTCDATGQVTIELPTEPIDMLRLWADSAGRVGWHAHWWPKFQPDGHLIPEEYTFQLETGTVIGGVVMNEAGEPIKGAKVAVSLVQPLASDFKVRTFRNIYLAEIESRHDTRKTTDAEGRWTLDNVPAGEEVEVLLKVSHPDYVGDQDLAWLQEEQGVSTKLLRDRTGTIVMRRAAKAASTPAPETGAPASASSTGTTNRTSDVQALGANDQPQAAAETRGVVSGDVVLAEGGTPVAGATVLLRDGRLHRSITDDMGKFRFNNIPQGHYRIWAFKERLASPKEPIIGQESSTDVKPLFSPIRLSMSTGKQIKVTVTSAVTAQPIEGAKVELEYPDRRFKLTSKDGTAVLQALLPERYTMTIQAAGHARVLREIDLMSADNLTFQSVLLAPGGTIRGTVTDENQKPLAKADIVFRFPESPIGFYGESPYADQEGQYRSLYLPLNTPIRVSAGLQDYLGEEQEVTLTDRQTDLLLNFQLQQRPRDGSVRGVVTDSVGKPIAGAEVLNFGNGSEKRETKTDPLGRFSLNDVMKNFVGHELIVRAPGFVPVRQKVKPAAAENTEVVSIKLEKGHFIRARVHNAAGQPVPGAHIDVNGGGFLGQAGESLRTDREGQFRSNSLPPNSTFRIYAAGYSTIDKTQLALDGEETVVVTLEPTGVLRGQVVDAATGKAIKQFRVRLGFSTDVRPGDVRGSYNSEVGDPGLTFNAEDGTFTITELTNRMPFKVMVEAEGYELAALPRVVAQMEANAAGVRVSLKKQEPLNRATVSGIVLDHQGKPVGSVQLRLIVSAAPSDGDDDNRFNWVLIDIGQLGKKDYVEQYLSAVTDGDGKFELKEVLPGKFLQIAYWGQTAPKGRTLALAKTKPGASQSVTIQLPEPAGIRGSFDAKAFPTASRMSLELQGQASHTYKLLLTDGKSDFAFENLPPGKYWLSVVGQPERVKDDPNLFSLRPIAARELTVQPGKILEVQITKDDQVQGGTP